VAKYMHTLDGCPATFDGEIVVFLARRAGKLQNILRDSLYQIRREQEASIQWQQNNGNDHATFEYGYIVFGD
jgi:hypothetical protein